MTQSEQPVSAMSPKLFDARVHRKASISLTPLIDVVFILLVFFMLSHDLTQHGGISLGRGVSQTKGATAPVVLSVAQGEIRLNDELVSTSSISRVMSNRLESHPDLMVHVQPVGNIPIQPVIDIMDELSTIGVSNLALIADPSWSDLSSRAPAVNRLPQ